MSGSGFTNISVVRDGIRVPVEPGGPATGDLTGSYPSPVVAQIQTFPVDPRVPAHGDTLIFTGGEWVPTPSPTSTTYFQGVWDAFSNSPDIANYPGLSDGFVWIVGTSGNTNVGGITGWIVGDYAVYSGGSWYKLSASSFGWLLGGNNGTSPSINYIGTADEADLSIRADGYDKLRVKWDGGVQVNENLIVTASLAVNGGNITTTASTFTLANSNATTVHIGAGATACVKVGNAAGKNILSGTTRFPQGLSGSLTKLTDGTSAFIGGCGVLVTSASNGAVTYAVDNSKFAALTGSVFSGPVQFSVGLSGSLTKLVDGTSAFVAGNGVLVTSASNGAITFTVDDSKFASLTGSVFTGPVQFTAGLSGSLTKLADGTSYLIAGNNATIVSQSNGSVVITAIPSGSNTQVQFNDGGTFGANGGLTYNKATGALTGTYVVATLGFSGSHTQLTDGTSAFTQGVGILVTSASNGAVTVTMSNTGSAGTYGNSSQVPVFSTDAQGRVGAAVNTPIAIDASQVVSGTFPSTVSVQNIYQNVTSQVSGGSAALVYGEVIYFTNSGGSATNPAVNRASAASASTAATTIGLVSSTTIPNGTAGQIITRGVLVGNPLGSPPYLNTNGFTQGDLLYVDPTTPGVLTNVRPSYPNFAIPVGIVIVKNQYTGAIYVDPSVGYNAADVVKIPAPSTKRTESAPGTTSILSTWFNGPPAISYLALDFNGGGNVTLSAGPIQAQTTSDYGRILWIHNVSTKTVTFNSGGTAYLSGGVALVLQPNSLVQFMWSFVGGGVGRWLQMGAPITVT